MTKSPHDARWFRNVLGQYPTGVCVVTAEADDGSRSGFVVGSFTSVSIDPPLIAFYPDKKSSSWPKIEAAGRFCVNILSAEQEHLCRQFAAKGNDKFDGVATRRSELGSPILEGAVAWIDCTIESVGDAGDHYIVMGRVLGLDIESGALPLLFFQGGYGRFAPHSLIAAYTPRGVSADQLRKVDLMRAEAEQLASDLSARSLLSARVGDDTVVLASAGSPAATARATLVGARLPFVPPNGSCLAAWADSSDVERWLNQLDDDAARQENRKRLERIRERGYSVGLLNEAQRKFAAALDQMAEDPDSVDSADLRSAMRDLVYDPAVLDESNEGAIRVIAVPITNEAGDVEFTLTLYGFARPSGTRGIYQYIQRVIEAAKAASAALGARN